MLQFLLLDRKVPTFGWAKNRNVKKHSPNWQSTSNRILKEGWWFPKSSLRFPIIFPAGILRLPQGSTPSPWTTPGTLKNPINKAKATIFSSVLLLKAAQAIEAGYYLVRCDTSKDGDESSNGVWGRIGFCLAELQLRTPKQKKQCFPESFVPYMKAPNCWKWLTLLISPCNVYSVSSFCWEFDVWCLLRLGSLDCWKTQIA